MLVSILLLYQSLFFACLGEKPESKGEFRWIEKLQLCKKKYCLSQSNSAYKGDQWSPCCHRKWQKNLWGKAYYISSYGLWFYQYLNKHSMKKQSNMGLPWSKRYWRIFHNSKYPEHKKKWSHIPPKLAFTLKIMGGDVLKYLPILSTPNRTFTAVITNFYCRSILKCLLMVLLEMCLLLKQSQMRQFSVHIEHFIFRILADVCRPCAMSRNIFNQASLGEQLSTISLIIQIRTLRSK